jgi:hypothetical protein
MNKNEQHKDIYYLIDSGTVVYASREHRLVVVYTGPELDVWTETLTEKGVFGGGYKHLDSREVPEEYADPDRTNIEAVTQEAEDFVFELLSERDYRGDTQEAA